MNTPFLRHAFSVFALRQARKTLAVHMSLWGLGSRGPAKPQSALQQLAQDLTAVGAEAQKRRLAPLKEVVDRALAMLALHAPDSDQPAVPNPSTADRVWYAFAMGATAFHQTSPALAAACCQNLGRAATLGYVPIDQIPMAAQMLGKLIIAPNTSATTTNDLDLETRALQALGSLAGAVESQPALLQDPLSIMHHLVVKSKHPSVRSAAGAAVAQVGGSMLSYLVGLSPSRSAAGVAGGSTSGDEVHHIAAAADYFQDCCRMVVGKSLEWLSACAFVPPSETAAAIVAVGILNSFLDVVATAVSPPPTGANTAAPVTLNADSIDRVAKLLNSAVPFFIANAPPRPGSVDFGGPPSGSVGRRRSQSPAAHGNDGGDQLTGSFDNTNAAAAAAAAAHLQTDFFVDFHKLLVLIATRFTRVCAPVTIQSILNCQAAIIVSGQTQSAANTPTGANATNPPMPASSSVSLRNEDAANVVSIIVLLWRRALASAELFAAFTQVEVAGDAELRQLAAAVTGSDDASEQLVSIRMHRRMGSDLSDDSDVGDRTGTFSSVALRTQRVEAFAAEWERTAFVKLLQAPIVLLEAVLLERQRLRALTLATADSRDSLVATHTDEDTVVVENLTPTRRANAIHWSPNLVMRLLDFCTIIAQTLARWMETVRQRRQLESGQQTPPMRSPGSSRTPTTVPLAMRYSTADEATLNTDAFAALGAHTFTAIWSPLYPCCSLALSLIDTDEVVHTTLAILRHLVHCACIGSVPTARDAVLRLLSDCAEKCGAVAPVPPGTVAASNAGVPSSFAAAAGSSIVGGPPSIRATPLTALRGERPGTGGRLAGAMEAYSLNSFASGVNESISLAPLEAASPLLMSASPGLPMVSSAMQQAAAAALQRQIHVLGALVSVANGRANELDGGWAIVIEALAAAQERLTDAAAVMCHFPVSEVAMSRVAIDDLFTTAGGRFDDHALRVVSEALASAGPEGEMLAPVHGTTTPQQRVDGDGPPLPLDSNTPLSRSATPTTDSLSGTPQRYSNALGVARLHRSPEAVAFICKCFARILRATVADAELPQVGIRRAALHVWPSIRTFISLGCAASELPTSSITQLVELCTEAVSVAKLALPPAPSRHQRKASTQQQHSSSSTPTVDAALTLLLEVFQKSDTWFSANPNCSPSNARLCVLKEAVRIVQTLCDALQSSASWRSVFRLAELATSTSPNEVLLAYRIPELARSNATTQLADTDAAAAFISCVGRFIVQRAAPDRVSLNLSAVQLLWSFSDVLSGTKGINSSFGNDDEFPRGFDSTGSGVLPPSSSSELSSSSIQALSVTQGSTWGALLLKLRDGASDSRLEVRHSCVKTLFSLLVSHADHIPALSWPIVAWDVLLPLMREHVMQPSPTHAGDLGPPVGGGGGSGSNKQLDEVSQSILEGTSRVLRVSHLVVTANVKDAKTMAEEVLTMCYSCLQGNCSEAVTFAAAKAVTGIVTDLLPYPDIISDRSVEHGFMCLERCLETANRPAPTGGRVSLACVKAVAEGAVECLFAARRRPAVAWSVSAESTYFHRTMAILERSSTAYSVENTYMYPSVLHTALMTSLLKLATEWIPQHAGSHTESYWNALTTLVLQQFPTTNEINSAVESDSLKQLPRNKNAQYITALSLFVSDKLLPVVPLGIIRSLETTLMVVALRTSTAGYIGDLKSVDATPQSASPPLSPPPPGVTAEAATAVAAVPLRLGSTVEAKLASAAVHLVMTAWRRIGSAATPSAALHAATTAAPALAAALRPAVQQHKDCALAIALVEVATTSIATDILAFLRSNAAPEVLAAVNSAIAELLTALLEVSAQGPDVCPRTTDAACELLFAVANGSLRMEEPNVTEQSGNSSQSFAYSVPAAETVLVQRSTKILSQCLTSTTASSMRQPLLQTLAWLAGTTPTMSFARNRAVVLAPLVIALVGHPATVADADMQNEMRHAMESMFACMQ
jgi:hypothetical protein